MRPNAYLSSLLFLLLLAGCAERLEMPSVVDGGSDRPGQTVADGTPIDVPFSVSYSPMTKSSLTIGEDAVTDINIVAFKNGTRVTFVYTTPDSDITLQLVKGESYNIYAVANVGAISIPSSESDFLDYSYSIDGAADLNGGFPMCWKYEGFTAGVLTSPVDIELERLVAKVRLTMPQGEVSGYSVTSVRLCQAAGVIRPFAEGGSKAESASEVCSGDYATPADLATLNGGGSIYFYTLENAQGTLIEGNTNPWNKVPDNMNGKDGVCTYIEITCEHDGSFLLDGTVTYRLYLGADNCSNFDVLRNKNYNLSLSTTYGGMNEFSWKVDVDVEITNAAEAVVEEGMHQEDDFYIGEVVLVGFDTSRAFDEFHGNEPTSDCEIVLVKNGVESDAAWFSPINWSDDYGVDSNYVTEMHCVSDITGAELYLKDFDGNLLCKVPFTSGNKVKIQKPRVFFSSQSSCAGQVSQLTSITPILNGGPETVYTFLVDNQGNNLNTDSQYFDLSLFDDLNCSLWFIGNPNNSIIVDYCSEVKTSLFGSNSACAKYELFLSIPKDEYKPRYSSIPRIWASIYKKNYNSLKYSINSSKIAVSDDLKGYFDIITPSFTWDMTNEKLIIHNPSYIDINFELYEVANYRNSQNHSYYRSVTTTGYHSSPSDLHIHKIALDIYSSTGVNYEAPDGSIIKELFFSLDYPDNNSNHATWMVTQSISGNSFLHNTDYLSIADGPSGDMDSFGHFLPFDSNDEMVSCGIDHKLTHSYYEYRFLGSLGQKTMTTDRVGCIVIKDIMELYDEVSRPHAKITLNYLSKGISATVTSDPYNIVYKTEVTDGKVSGTCTHRNYSTQSYSTDNHNIYIPGSTSTTLSGGTNYNIGAEVYSHSYGTSSHALSSSDIAQYMKALNIGCWSNSCDKAVANANNRFSSFTQPSSFNVEFAAYGQNRFVPIDIITNIVNSNATVEGNIFTSTNPGTYSLDHYGDSNLDGSTRNKKNINSEVKVSTSNSSYVTGKAYTLTVSAKEDSSFTYYIR